MAIFLVNTVQALLSPRGGYLISGPKRGGLIREGSLTEKGGGVNREGGAYWKSDVIDNNFPNFAIIPVTIKQKKKLVLYPHFTNATSFKP